jgi:hypothetical protein
MLTIAPSARTPNAIAIRAGLPPPVCGNCGEMVVVGAPDATWVVVEPPPPLDSSVVVGPPDPVTVVVVPPPEPTWVVVVAGRVLVVVPPPDPTWVVVVAGIVVVVVGAPPVSTVVVAPGIVVVVPVEEQPYGRETVADASAVLPLLQVAVTVTDTLSVVNGMASSVRVNVESAVAGLGPAGWKPAGDVIHHVSAGRSASGRTVQVTDQPLSAHVAFPVTSGFQADALADTIRATARPTIAAPAVAIARRSPLECTDECCTM